MNYKLKNKIKKVLFATETGHKFYKLMGKSVQNKRKKLSDREYIELSFKENTGKNINIDNPVTFNDKLLWLSLYDRDPLKTKCADKVLVRDYVKECGYEEYLNTIYGVYDNVKDIDFSTMPEKIMVKTNHDSGNYALIDKNDAKTMESLKKIQKALKKNYYDESREWQYKDIEPKIICEKYIETTEKYGLIDYRFYCFDGIIGFIAVDIGTTGNDGKHSYVAKRNLYDKNFNIIPGAKLKRENFDSNLIKKPKNFEKMKEIAINLSKGFKHVRVDLYNVDGHIIFGEMTFCNGGGMQLLEPEDLNVSIGKMINLE